MNISDTPRYTLKQHTRLIIAFFGALALLSMYQYIVLYAMGVLDAILSISFFLAIVHHLGYASIAGLICVPLFNFLENWRSRMGFKAVAGVLLGLLIVETFLVGYYILTLSPLGYDIESFSFINMTTEMSTSWHTLIFTILALGLIIWMFRRIYLLTKKHYHHIAKMYPFTIILFSVFVATLFLDGKPINQNKTQYLTINLFEKARKNNQGARGKEEFENKEIVWINSVFSGKNCDKAYLTAKDLAYDKEYDKSLLLSRYILSEVPDHIDTKILMGRINAWNGDYNKSISILKGCIMTNPDYIDAYSALLDVYYWSDRNEDAKELLEIIGRTGIPIKEIEDKIARARLKYAQKASKSAQRNTNKTEAQIVSAEQ